MSRIAGRLKFFVNAWASITNDEFILNCISGCKIRFSSEPVQDRLPKQNCLNSKDKPLLEEAVSNLFNLGAIKKV